MVQSLEKEIEQLRNENNHLLKVIEERNSYHDVDAGEMFQGKDVSGSGYLALQLSNLFTQSLRLPEKINKAFSLIGDFFGLNRIYIYENRDTNSHCRLSYEWLSSNGNGCCLKLQALLNCHYQTIHNLLFAEGVICATNVQIDLPSKVGEIFSFQGIKSYLSFPLVVNGEYTGYLAVDECCRYREWSTGEIELMHLLARLISKDMGHELNNKSLLEHANIQTLLLDISKSLARLTDFNQQVFFTLKKLVQNFGLKRALFFEDVSAGSYCKCTIEYYPTGQEELKGKLNRLEYQNDLPGWKEMFNTKGSINSLLLNNKEIKDNAFSRLIGEDSYIILPLHSGVFIHGFFAFIIDSDKELSLFRINALHTVVELFLGLYERYMAGQEMNEVQDDIIELNKILAEKEGFLEAVLESIPVGILLVKDRIVKFANNVIEASAGYSRSDIKGIHFSKLYLDGKEDISDVDRFYREIDQKGISTIYTNFKRKNGDLIVLRNVGKPAPPSILENGYLLISEDITHLRNAQRNLNESEERFRKIIETTTDGIFIFDDNEKLIYMNAAGESMIGYSYQEVITLSENEIFPNIGFIRKFKKALVSLKEGEDYEGDIQLNTKNNGVVFANASGSFITINGRKHYYFSLRNTTRRIKHAAKLKQSEKKFRALTENSSDHILRVSKNGNIIFCNPAFLSDLDLRDEEILGKKVNDVQGIPPGLKVGLNKAYNHVVITEELASMDFEYMKGDAKVAFDWTITPEFDDDQYLQSLLLVGRDFTAKKNVEKELIIAKEKAVGADRLKSAFLANMSHEIRTPLNAIVGFTHLLKDDTLTENEKDEYINIISHSSDTLLSLINDIVDLAKIESGHYSIAKESMQPAKFLNALHGLFEKKKHLDNKSHLSLILNMPHEDLWIESDENKLRQIFINLIGNALKFTLEGSIEFGCELGESEVRFYVKDTGIGIHQEKQDVIFSPFRQEEIDTSQRYGGTGLGLSICKGLINAMGSQIHLKTEKGIGSEFYFYLPIQKVGSVISF